MSEFFHAESPSASSEPKPMAALVKDRVMYMSCSGPGSRRSFEIPAYDLDISEEWKITSFKEEKTRNSGFGGVHLSNPNQLFELQESHLADLDALVAAKQAFEAAAATYEAAKSAFRASATGTMIDNILVPDKPLPETVEARVPPCTISSLIDTIQSHSINPIEEEITVSAEFHGYKGVYVTLMLKIGINKEEFVKFRDTLENRSRVQKSDGVVKSISFHYDDDYPPYRESDLEEVSQHDKTQKEFMQVGGRINNKVDNCWISALVKQGMSETDKEKYVAEQLAALKNRR